MLLILTLHDRGLYHVGTSPLICRADQWTGFYIITASIMKELKAHSSLTSKAFRFRESKLEFSVLRLWKSSLIDYGYQKLTWKKVQKITFWSSWKHWLRRNFSNFVANVTMNSLYLLFSQDGDFSEHLTDGAYVIWNIAIFQTSLSENRALLAPL